MCIAHRLLLSTSEISDATASMPSPGYFALQHRVAPPRKAYSLTSSAFIAFGEEQRWLRLREELRAHVPEPRERLVGFREGSHVFHGAFQLEILRNRRAACRGAVV